MKKFTIVLLLLISLFFQGHSQKLEEDTVDEFTGAKIKRTSWKSICETMKFVAYFRLSRINDNFYFDLKVMNNNKVFSIDKGSQLMFKMSTGDVVELQSLEYAITCRGCGSISISGSATEGIETRYTMTLDQFNKLKTGTATKFRIYTSIGYLEDDYKANNYEKLKTALNLIQ